MINAQKLNELSSVIEKEIPGLGFAIVVFAFGDGLREFRYISNAQREDMLQAFDALLTKWKNESPKNN